MLRMTHHGGACASAWLLPFHHIFEIKWNTFVELEITFCAQTSFAKHLNIVNLFQRDTHQRGIFTWKQFYDILICGPTNFCLNILKLLFRVPTTEVSERFFFLVNLCHRCCLKFQTIEGTGSCCESRELDMLSPSETEKQRWRPKTSWICIFLPFFHSKTYFIQATCLSFRNAQVLTQLGFHAKHPWIQIAKLFWNKFTIAYQKR